MPKHDRPRVNYGGSGSGGFVNYGGSGSAGRSVDTGPFVNYSSGTKRRRTSKAMIPSDVATTRLRNNPTREPLSNEEIQALVGLASPEEKRLILGVDESFDVSTPGVVEAAARKDSNIANRLKILREQGWEPQAIKEDLSIAQKAFSFISDKYNAIPKIPVKEGYQQPGVKLIGKLWRMLPDPNFEEGQREPQGPRYGPQGQEYVLPKAPQVEEIPIGERWDEAMQLSYRRYGASGRELPHTGEQRREHVTDLMSFVGSEIAHWVPGDKPFAGLNPKSIIHETKEWAGFVGEISEGGGFGKDFAIANFATLTEMSLAFNPEHKYHNRRYARRVDFYKAKGYPEHVASSKAFMERKDVPDGLKNAASIVGDPGILYGGVRSLAQVGKGLMSLGKTIYNAESILPGFKASPMNIMSLPTDESILARGEAPSRVPRFINRAFDPASELKHLPDGEKKSMLEVNILNKRIVLIGESQGNRTVQELHSLGKWNEVFDLRKTSDGLPENIAHNVRYKKPTRTREGGGVTVDVYHGTRMEPGPSGSGLPELNIGAWGVPGPKQPGGLHFGTRKAAQDWLVDNPAQWAGESKEGRIVKSRIRLEKPYGSASKPISEDAAWKLDFQKLRDEGYDGLIYRNIAEDAGSVSYIAFNPEQAIIAGVGKVPRTSFKYGAKPRPYTTADAPTIGDVLRTPDKFDLSPQQRAMTDAVTDFYRRARNFLESEGIDVHKYGAPEEAIFYAARRVIGKRKDGKFMEIGYTGRGTGNPFFEKSRAYLDMADGMKEGFVYDDIFGSMNAYVRGMYRVVGRKHAEKRILGITRAQTADKGFLSAQAMAKKTVERQVNAIRSVGQVIKGYRLPSATKQSIERAFPALSQDLDNALGAKGRTRTDALLEIRDNMKTILPGSRAESNLLTTQASISKRIARTARPTEEAISPVLPSRVFTGPNAAKNAEDIEKVFMDRGTEWIIGQRKLTRAFTNMTDALRFMKTGWDFGVANIQLLPVLFKEPEAWGRGVGLSIRAFGDKGVRAKYIADNADVTTEAIQRGLHIGSTEVTETMVGGGWMAKIPMAVASVSNPVFMKTVAPAARTFYRTAERFQVQYETALDVARIEIYKSLRQTAINSGERNALEGLAEFANKVTGMTQTRAMGVPASQRAIESSLFMFSPQYTRATVSLFLDMTRGGLRGDQARKAVSELMVGMYSLHAAAAMALNQDPNFDPSKPNWLRVKIHDQWIGFGGKPRALIMMLTDLVKQASGPDADGLLNWNTFSPETYDQNKFLRRLRYQTPPGVSSFLNLVTGTDPIGRTIPDWEDDTWDFMGFMGQEVLPFAVDAAIEGAGGGLGGMFMGFASEQIGGAVIPERPFEVRDEILDKHFRSDHGMPLAEAKNKYNYQQMHSEVLRNHKDARDAAQTALDEQDKFHRNNDRMLFRAARDDSRAAMVSAVGQAGAVFLQGGEGRESGDVFRATVNKALRDSGKQIETIRRNYPSLRDKSEAYWEKRGEESEVIAATNEWMDARSGPDMFRADGRPDYLKRDDVWEELTQRYGEKMMKQIKINQRLRMVEELGGEDMSPEHKVVMEYFDSHDTLRDYWEAYKEALPKDQWGDWEMFQALPAGTQSDALWDKTREEAGRPVFWKMEREVEKKRWEIQSNDPKIDIDLARFYGRRPLTKEGWDYIQAKTAYGTNLPISARPESPIPLPIATPAPHPKELFNQRYHGETYESGPGEFRSISPRQ